MPIVSPFLCSFYYSCLLSFFSNMKILIVDNAAMVCHEGHYCTNNLNGAFLEELIDAGHMISYLQFVSSSTNSISVFDLAEKGVRCVPVKSEGRKVFRYIRAALKMCREIARTDFVYLYLPNSLRFASFISRLFRKPYGVYVRGMKGLTNRQSIRIYKNAFAVFTVSDGFTKQIIELSGKNRVFSIKPMIPFSDEDVVENRQYSRPDKFVVLFLGRVAFDKGVGELINAVKAIVSKGNVDMILKIVGSGEFIEEAKVMVAQLGIDENVEIMGPVYDDREKRNCYLNAHLYVLPTYHEGFPRTLYEAMIFGTPIITTFVGGIPALMKDKVNCLQIVPKSMDSIVEGLNFAFCNYEQMCQFAMNARETVRPIIDRKRPTHAQHLIQILTNQNQNYE